MIDSGNKTLEDLKKNDTSPTSINIPNIADRARTAGLERLYNLFYRNLCDGSHPNTQSIEEYIDFEFTHDKNYFKMLKKPLCLLTP